MRVTQNMMTNGILQHLSDGYGKIADLQNQLASGKKITRPSQDPVVATMGIAYRTDVSHVAQYQKNVTTAQKWLDSSDSALGQVNDVLQRVRELVTEASNDTYTADQRAAAGVEVDQLTRQLVTLGNTQIGGQYIFSGNDTATPLLSEDAGGTVTLTAKMTSPDVPIQVNDGVKISVNVDPGKVFTPSLFSDLNSLSTALKSSSSTSAGISGFLGTVDGHLDEVASAQADVGAKEDRVKMISNRLDSQKTMATNVMANNEDADYAQTIVDLNQQQNVYNAALSVGARIIQTSLVDFLK
ncbi:flagellar hook-associated protein FlgL [Sporolactobacillus vineae]|uniref:flagellar hook-associated protein FlgL n=1 Tax=Sporolactobacillus vineae TaxID=444463 RepID=UPI000289087A|nr:flagellar hook-associated protein FlgL [Sporolactobacillus vineae]